MNNPIKTQVEIDYKYLSLSLNKKLLYNPFSFPVHICSQILSVSFGLRKCRYLRPGSWRVYRFIEDTVTLWTNYNTSYKKISDTECQRSLEYKTFILWIICGGYRIQARVCWQWVWFQYLEIRGGQVNADLWKRL